MKIKTVVPTWTRSKKQFFERDAFPSLINHYESVRWGFYGLMSSALTANSWRSNSPRSTASPGLGMLRSNGGTMACSSPRL